MSQLALQRIVNILTKETEVRGIIKTIDSRGIGVSTEKGIQYFSSGGFSLDDLETAVIIQNGMVKRITTTPSTLTYRL